MVKVKVKVELEAGRTGYIVWFVFIDRDRELL